MYMHSVFTARALDPHSEMGGLAASGEVGDFYESQKESLSKPATDANIEAFTKRETDFFPTQDPSTKTAAKLMTAGMRAWLVKQSAWLQGAPAQWTATVEATQASGWPSRSVRWTPSGPRTVERPWPTPSSTTRVRWMAFIEPSSLEPCTSGQGDGHLWNRQGQFSSFDIGVRCCLTSTLWSRSPRRAAVCADMGRHAHKPRIRARTSGARGRLPIFPRLAFNSSGTNNSVLGCGSSERPQQVRIGPRQLLGNRVGRLSEAHA